MKELCEKYEEAKRRCDTLTQVMLQLENERERCRREWAGIELKMKEALPDKQSYVHNGRVYTHEGAWLRVTIQKKEG